MEARFGRAPLASPPAPNFGTVVVSSRTFPQAPHNVRLYGTLSRSLADSWVLSLSSPSVGPPLLWRKTTLAWRSF